MKNTVPSQRSEWQRQRRKWLAARCRWLERRRSYLAEFHADVDSLAAEAEAAHSIAGLEMLRLTGVLVEAPPRNEPAAHDSVDGRRHRLGGYAARPRVLIVDANRSDRIIMGEALTAAGWDVDLAAGAAEATRLALRQRPDVALIDLSPTVDDVVAVVIGLRCEHGLELPILAMSTGPDSGKAERLGIACLLQKPIVMRELLRQLASLARAAGWRGLQ